MTMNVEGLRRAVMAIGDRIPKDDTASRQAIAKIQTKADRLTTEAYTHKPTDQDAVDELEKALAPLAAKFPAKA